MADTVTDVVPRNIHTHVVGDADHNVVRILVRCLGHPVQANVFFRIINLYSKRTTQNTTCTGSLITAHLSINQRKSNSRLGGGVSILQRSAEMFMSTTAIWWISQAVTIKHTIKLKPSCTLIFLRFSSRY